MGERGPIGKSPDDKQGRHKPRVIQLFDKQELEVPAPPDGLLPRVDNLWASYFKSIVARAIDYNADQGLLRRWILSVDQWERALDVLRDPDNDTGITDYGSQGQIVIHPLVKFLQQTENQITKYEKELGLTPMSRARLGLTIAEGELTAQQINKLVDNPPALTEVEEAEIIEAEAQSGWQQV